MQGPFISEEKVVFGIHAHAMSQMTISKMRKVYNKVDSKSIAKQVNTKGEHCPCGQYDYKKDDLQQK